MPRGCECVYVSLHMIIIFPESCKCVCVFVCLSFWFWRLNSPLFSLLILAAAASEAWANDDEVKRAGWLSAQLTLSPSQTVFDQKDDAEQRKLALF